MIVKHFRAFETLFPKTYFDLVIIYYLAHIKCVRSVENILHNPTHQVNNPNDVLEEKSI